MDFHIPSNHLVYHDFVVVYFVDLIFVEVTNNANQVLVDIVILSYENVNVEHSFLRMNVFYLVDYHFVLLENDLKDDSEIRVDTLNYVYIEVRFVVDFAYMFDSMVKTYTKHRLEIVVVKTFSIDNFEVNNRIMSNSVVENLQIVKDN